MKKAALSIILAISLIISGVKPASAAMIDVTQILGKVAEYLQKVADTTKKISQQINQVKLMVTQGYDLSELRNFADDFFIKELHLDTKIKQMVDGSLKKKEGRAKWNRDLYKAGSYQNFKTKEKVSKSDREYLKGQLEIARNNLAATESECGQKRYIYELQDPADVREKDRKYGIYMECITRRDLYAAQVEELTKSVAYMQAVYEDQKMKRIRAEDGDKNFVERHQHRATVPEAAGRNRTDTEEAKFAQVDIENAEWDTEGNAKSYTQDWEYYYKFVRRYFYDPEDPAFKGEGPGKEKTVLFQSNLDRLKRERRFLYINTAAHLMQVASTSRREIAKREKGQSNMEEHTAASPNEYQAMATYSATRIEHMKALLLYAQVQSAKLQYLATRELLEADLRKDYENKKDSIKFDKIDLKRYLMDE